MINTNVREDLKNYWLQRGWPDDRSFVAALQDFALYRRETKKCRLILESLEEAKAHREAVDLSKTTIEHVLPQAIGRDASGMEWRRTLGDGWVDVHERLLHTLGNLTLSAYNF